MSSERVVTTGNSLVIDGPEVVRGHEPTLIEQLESKTDEYLDYSKRVDVYLALESEFVQEFVDSEGIPVVSEALSRLYADRLFGGSVNFTSFMRSVLEVRAGNSADAADNLSRDVTRYFRWSQDLFCGDNPPQGMNANLLAAKQRQYTPARFEMLEKKLASAAPDVKRPRWVAALAHIASEMTKPELDEDDIEVNGFEKVHYDFDRDAFETDMTNNGALLIDSRLSCIESMYRTEKEIDSLIAQEQAKLRAELEQARQQCILSVKSGLGEDFIVGWSTVSDGLKVERVTPVDPQDFKDGVSQAEVDSVIMPAMLVYSQAISKCMSDHVKLRTHDYLGRLRLTKSPITTPYL